MHNFLFTAALRRIGYRAHKLAKISTATGYRSRTVAAIAGAIAFSVCAQSIGETTVTLLPAADTYDQQGMPSTNYGNASTMLVRIDAANSLTRHGYLQFDLSSLPPGPITSAVLRVYGAQDPGGTGVTIGIFGNTAAPLWSETLLTWANAHSLTSIDFNSVPLSSMAVSTTAQYFDSNVTSYVKARRIAGNATFGLYPLAANTYRATFNSKEATLNKPQLVVTIGYAPLIVARTPIDDTYTQQNTPTTNYGTATTVLVRKDAANSLTRYGYFNFSLNLLPCCGIISAKLQLFGSQDQGGTGVNIKALGGTGTFPWDEAQLNFTNADTTTGVDLLGPALSTVFVSPPPAKLYSWDVTSYITSYMAAHPIDSEWPTVALAYTAPNTYRSTFNSKEAASDKPQLVLTLDPGLPPPEAPPPGPALSGSCPANYVAHVGTNTNFPHGGINRAFVLNLPADISTPRPVWVPLTGSVESTNENLDARGGNRAMTSEGFIVIGPVRRCAGQNPAAAGTSVNGSPCNQAGTGGWDWNAWNESRVFGVAGDPWKTNEGDDSTFLEAIVRCVAKTYQVDSTRLFLGGVSTGGNMTNRALTFNSDFWAGGIPMSSEWNVTQDDGNAFPGTNALEARRAAVAANPTKIFQGRVGPYPLFNTLGNTTQLSPMIVITLWGGANDLWSCPPLCFDNRQSTQASSNYFSAQPNVVHVACTGHHGLQWPTFQRDAWNRWVLRMLASHPKGTPKSAFVLPSMQSVTNGALADLGRDYSCVVGRYTDHY